MNGMHRFRNKWTTWTAAGLVFCFTALPPAGAWAQSERARRHPAPDIRYGKTVNRLPAGHRAVQVRKAKHHYHHGVYYRPRGRGYVVVRPPVGAVVAGLTAAAVLVAVAGSNYYYCNDAYYRKVPAGYQVVDVPVQDSAVSTAGGRVRVTVGLLNVRYGPGLHHPVVRQVSAGSVMTVRGNAPGWLYVELGDGTQGWVMDVYTAAVAVARG